MAHDKELAAEIKEAVKALEFYDDQVAEDFLDMVWNWRDERDRPVLVLWQDKLNTARTEYKTEPAGIAEVEVGVIGELCRRIDQETGVPEDIRTGGWHLAEVVHNKEAVCLAKAGQLLCILSDSLHLSVAVLDVTAISDPSVRLPFEATHIDCLFTLSNGMTVMTDIVSPETVVSDQFDFERTFEPCGNHWEIKDTQNPLGLHRRFRKLDHDGLVSELYRRQGQAFDMSGEMIQAISWFEQAIKRDPKNANACVSLGVAYGKSGALRKAIGYLELAIKQDPKNPPAYDNLGMCYEQLGEFHTAISWREKAIQLDDRFVKAHNNLGSVYYKLGDLKKALHYCGKANQLDPEHAPTHYNLGVIYRDLGDIRKAEHHYGEAHRLDPRRFGPRGYFS